MAHVGVPIDAGEGAQPSRHPVEIGDEVLVADDLDGQRQHSEALLDQAHRRVIVVCSALEAGEFERHGARRELGPEAAPDDIARIAAQQHDARVGEQPRDDRQLEAFERVHVDENFARRFGTDGGDFLPVGDAERGERDPVGRGEPREPVGGDQEGSVGVGKRRTFLDRLDPGGAGKDVFDQRVARARVAEQKDVRCRCPRDRRWRRRAAPRCRVGARQRGDGALDEGDMRLGRLSRRTRPMQRDKAGFGVAKSGEGGVTVARPFMRATEQRRRGVALRQRQGIIGEQSGQRRDRLLECAVVDIHRRQRQQRGRFARVDRQRLGGEPPHRDGKAKQCGDLSEARECRRAAGIEPRGGVIGFGRVVERAAAVEGIAAFEPRRR